jgi:cysteine desulfurase/selenocysteine lyase
MMAEQYGIIIEFISITNDYDIDRDDFQQKMTQKVKAVAISMCSNSTGTIIDVQKAKKIAGNERIVIVDGSQIVGKRAVDVDIL